MRTLSPLLGLLVAAFVGLACARPLAAPPSSSPRPTSFQRGVGLGLFATDEQYDYAHLLDEIVAHGATDVLVVVPWYQSDVGAHDIAPREGYSPADETVLRTLQQAKARGLRTSLLPIVRLIHRTPTEWRGRIEPRAGVELWFETYQRFLVRMGQLAAAGGADRLGVGSELLSLERHEARWRALIQRVREVTPSRLYYSANWDHFEPIRFWDALDEVGVTAYFELSSNDETPSPEQLRAAWREPARALKALRARTGKPLVVTELGYPSIQSAARYPWDETRKAPLDLALQATLYDAACGALVEAKGIDGLYFWNWFGFGGAHDATYTPRGKPAAAAMRRCLVQPRWDAPPPSPQP